MQHRESMYQSSVYIGCLSDRLDDIAKSKVKLCTVLKCLVGTKLIRNVLPNLRTLSRSKGNFIVCISMIKSSLESNYHTVVVSQRFTA